MHQSVGCFDRGNLRYLLFNNALNAGFQSHLGHWAAYARAFEADCHNVVVINADQLYIATVALDLGTDQVYDFLHSLLKRAQERHPL